LIGSGVRVSVSFQHKYPLGSVLRCPTAAKNGGYDWGGHFVVLLCEQRTTDAALSARRLPPFVETLFFTLRDSYGWQH